MWDLATAKIVTGTTGTTSDAALTSVMDVVLGTVEDLLGRGLLYKRSAETYYHVDTRRFRLHRYPIDRIVSVNGNAVSTNNILVHHRVGWVELDGGGAEQVTIDYIGGFKQLPAALERAMWEAFQALWTNSDPVTGAPIAGSGGSTVTAGSGDISRVSLPGGGAVSWDVGATVSGGSSGGGSSATDQATWGWLAPWASTLQMFRTESAPSLNFA
jgi:hypothetical protein